MQSSANFKLLFYVNYIEKPKIKKEKPGMAPFLKKPQAEKTFDLEIQLKMLDFYVAV